ncbi:MAG: TRAP transporter substrate-binding protein [Deltaproteobacteria bacterium]|nr:TRAP transporter substrate-binding protein [Deltaproteobacteria bacterium]
MSRSLLAVCAALLTCCLALPAAAEPVTLTYSNFFPPAHFQSKLAEAWCAEVTKQTEGRVKFQYYPGQTLTNAPQAYEGVVSGLSDLAMGCFAYTRGRFPVMEVVDLPLGYTSGVQATQVVNEVCQALQPKELDQVAVMYLHAHGPGLIFTRTKPVKCLADLKGLKIRATGTTGELVKALGGTPVSMPMPEVYQALSRGVVDGAVYPMESNMGWKLAEVTRYGALCTSMAYTTSFFVVMNKDKWATLSPADQKIIRAINQTWAARTGAAWDTVDRAGWEFFLGLPEHQLVEVAPADAEAFRQAAQPVLTAFAESLDAKGFQGRKILDVARKAVAQAGK